MEHLKFAIKFADFGIGIATNLKCERRCIGSLQTDWASEESDQQMAATGLVGRGMACKGDYCDKIRLIMYGITVDNSVVDLAWVLPVRAVCVQVYRCTVKLCWYERYTGILGTLHVRAKYISGTCIIIFVLSSFAVFQISSRTRRVEKRKREKGNIPV